MEKDALEKVLQNHAVLFTKDLGCYNGPPVKFDVTKDAPFFKALPVPYALRSRVATALEKMQNDGVIKSVPTASSAAPIVPVEKKNNEVQLCGDFSVTFNAVAEEVSYPIPKIDDIHAALRGCKEFSVLDLSQAYHQIPIAKESQKHLVINTMQGLFAFQRMPNGIHSGPAVFQRMLDTVLAGIRNVVCYIDDILVGGTDEQDQLRTLSLVFQ